MKKCILHNRGRSEARRAWEANPNEGPSFASFCCAERAMLRKWLTQKEITIRRQYLPSTICYVPSAPPSSTLQIRAERQYRHLPFYSDRTEPFGFQPIVLPGFASKRLSNLTTFRSQLLHAHKYLGSPYRIAICR